MVDDGLGARTGIEGIRQLAALVEPYRRLVVPVPIIELERLEGCVTCVSVRIRS